MGTRAASRSPRKTASPSAASMPSVVPSVTRPTERNSAASATVASWVLSAISATKNRTTVVRNGPNRAGRACSSILSGTSVQRPKPTKVAASTAAITRGGT